MLADYYLPLFFISVSLYTTSECLAAWLLMAVSGTFSFTKLYSHDFVSVFICFTRTNSLAVHSFEYKFKPANSSILQL
jgi:hypothetical protein